MKWEYSSADGYETDALARRTGISRIAARILLNRGVSDEKAVREFFSDIPVLADPFLMKDMDKAVKRIDEALDGNEKIAVFGDYDADGITATAIVYTFLRSMGADVIYALPERDDSGYGMNAKTVERFREDHVSLVITVDTGITAFEEAKAFASAGIDLIVTDHHKPRCTLPQAYAVVDPHREDCQYPYKYLAGVGVAFKLLCAVAENRKSTELLDVYCDMMALGSIADLVPVTGENRHIIREGLRKMNTSPNEGIRALINAAGYSGRRISASGVAFGLAPRINAAGRVASPLRALELLMCSDSVMAAQYADMLCRDNDYRRELESNIFFSAVSVIESDRDIRDKKILVVSGDKWHQGVIGIVAARLAERYSKPVILFTNDGTVAQGSGRSREGFNILRAIESCEDMLIKFGGHEFAAGVQLKAELIDDFRDRINAYADTEESVIVEKTLFIDSGISLSEINLRLAREISRFEPYGGGNPQPVFAAANVEILYMYPTGNGKHVRMVVTDGNAQASLVVFGKTKDDIPFSEGDMVDVAFTIVVNEWRGKETASLSAVDFRPSACYIQNDASMNNYGRESIAREMLPKREDFADVYSFLEKNGIKCFDIYALSSRINARTGRMTALKLRLITDIFSELGIADVNITDTAVKIKIISLKNKVRLETAPTAVKYSIFAGNG